MGKPEGVKHSVDSRFYKRQRSFAQHGHGMPGGVYSLKGDTVQVAHGKLTASLAKNASVHDSANTAASELSLTMFFLTNGLVRISIADTNRIQSQELHVKAAKLTVKGDPNVDISVAVEKDSKQTNVCYGKAKEFKMILDHKSLQISFQRNNETHVLLNGGGCLNIEGGSAENKGDWAEKFLEFTDSVPRGPQSLGLDINFPGYKHVFGIPEHTSPLSLKGTRGGQGNYDEPYRMFNLDASDYEVDSPAGLYGCIPFMQAHKMSSDVAVFWLNTSETWVDVDKNEEETQTHWSSETGIMDIFVFLGPSCHEVYKNLGELVGFTALPQEFALGYHQSRWNYEDEDDVKQVDGKFDEFDIPYDVIWLDIEYTNGKRYFTWDAKHFPTPDKMLAYLEESKRKLVVIIDPHIKKDDAYWVYKELISKDLAVKTPEGKAFEGNCWPGNSVWVDTLHTGFQEWWKSLFHSPKFLGFKSNLFIWNDMNEPAVFGGPEKTSPKDNVHYGGFEHRDIHNIYGSLYHRASANAIEERADGAHRRPFILSRSFYAGSQTTTTIWTGDNQSSWEHLQVSIPMLLSNGIAGMTFCGADVGGFIGEPSTELLTRWYQAGAFYPFFRGHSDHSTKRREPYLAGEPSTSIRRAAIKLRYSLLPIYYTSIQRSSVDGMPILRPQFVQFPDDEQGFHIDDQFYIGDSGLLAKPITTEGATSEQMYIADDQVYYDYWTLEKSGKRGCNKFDVTMDTIPLLLQGGHILTRKDNVHGSSLKMRAEPYTLVVAISREGTAKGEIYSDDGETFAFQKGDFIHKGMEFSQEKMQMSSFDVRKGSPHSAFANVMIEKVIFLGFQGHVEAVKIEQSGSSWEASVHKSKSVLTIVEPKLQISNNWKIHF